MANSLTVAAWKKVLQGHAGAPDGPRVTKALEAFAKAESGTKDDPGPLLDAIKDLTAAAKSARAGSAKEKSRKPLVDFLDDLLSEAAARKEQTERLVREKSKRSGDDGDEDGDEAGDALRASLVRVKTLEAESARPFVLALGTVAGLVIAKRPPISRDHRITARDMRTGKGKILLGKCYGEDGKYVFEFEEKPAGGMTKVIKKAAKVHAEMDIRLKVRGAGEELDDELDTGELVDLGDDYPDADAPDTRASNASGEEASTAFDAPSPTAPPRTGRGSADFASQLKETLTLAKRAAYLSSGVGMLAGGLVREAQALFAAGKPADALEKIKILRDMANAAITSAGPMADQMIADAQKAEAEDTERAAHAKGDPMKGFTDRLKRLQPRIKTAVERGNDLGQEAKRLATEAGMYARKQDFHRANQGLDRLEAALDGPLAPTAPTLSAAVDGASSTVILQQSRLAWDAARKKVGADLARLRKAMLDSFDEEPERAAATRAAEKIGGLMEVFDGRLSQALDEVLNAESPEERHELHEQAASLIRNYRAFVARDPIIKALEVNPFVPVSVEKILVTTLGVLGSKLQV
jgi:gas vesicle protein